MTTYNCAVESELSEGLAHAARAISAEQCVVLPTDTVYGIAADAFSPRAVAMLLASKGRGRNMPPPVLVPRISTLDGLAVDVSEDVRTLVRNFWPGGLTVICTAQPSLRWDLGETFGTVALRMPDDTVALDLLAQTGPLAVSSANRTGQPAARTAAEARSQLAESVEVYLDDGVRPRRGGGSGADGGDPGSSSADDGASSAPPSTIVDATGGQLRIVREGVLSLATLREVVPGVLGLGEEPEGTGRGSADGEPTAAGGS